MGFFICRFPILGFLSQIFRFFPMSVDRPLPDWDDPRLFDTFLNIVSLYSDDEIGVLLTDNCFNDRGEDGLEHGLALVPLALEQHDKSIFAVIRQTHIDLDQPTICFIKGPL